MFCFVLSDLRVPESRNEGRGRVRGGEEIGERRTMRERGKKKREGKRKKGKEEEERREGRGRKEGETAVKVTRNTPQ